ncbi:tetratricopeptide repeat protein [Desulfovibrio sp. JY]|nr:tetratricopeptide repeat protein [Desulfovibrio sp. JY]
MACVNGKCQLASSVRQLREAGMEALRDGDMVGAEALLRRSVAMSEAGGGVATATAHSVYKLGMALHAAGRQDEAAEQFEKALWLVRERAGCDSKLYRKILGHFAEAMPSRAPLCECEAA